MPDSNTTAEYFQDKADSAKTPWEQARYQRCADQYRAQTSERKLTQAMQQLMEAAGALLADGQRRKAEEYLPTIREIVRRQRQLIERKRKQGLDTVTSLDVLHNFRRRVAKLEHNLVALGGDINI